MKNRICQSIANPLIRTAARLIALAGLLLAVGCSRPIPADISSEALSEQTVPAEVETVQPEAVIEKKPIELPEGEADDGGFTISQIMLAAHDSQLYRAALKETPDSDVLEALKQLYSDLPKRTPPKGAQEDWEPRATALVVAVNAIVAGEPDATSQFKRAVNCNSCHSRHR